MSGRRDAVKGRGPLASVRCAFATPVPPVTFVVLALVMCVGPASASSRYSLRGEGETVLANRADARALGSAEAASSVPSLTGNPASLAFAERGQFYGTWETEWIRAEESLPGGNQVAKEYSGLISNLGLVFPLPRNWVFGSGLVVERRKDGFIEQSAATPDGRSYLQTFEASGNHLRIPVTVAWRGDRFQAGTGLDLTLLNSEVRWRNDFGDNEDFADTNDLDKLHLFSMAWRAGLRVPVGPRLSAGAWLSLPSEADGKRRLENDDNDDSDDLNLDFSADLPTRISAGLEGRPHDRVRLAADWMREGWGDVTPARPGDVFVDVNRFSLGAEWEPSSSGDRSSPLRAGYRTEPLHVKDVNGDEIREHALTFGSGFGFAGGAGEIDWYVEYLWRGVADESEYYEQAVRFGVTLTGFEEWARRRPPEAEEDW